MRRISKVALATAIIIVMPVPTVYNSNGGIVNDVGIANRDAWPAWETITKVSSQELPHEPYL